jgi:hypothetical protein
MVRLARSAAAALALLTAACETAEPGPCGGGGGNDDVGVPCGAASHLYVVDQISLPTTAALTEQFGLNLDGDEQNRPDDAVGRILSTLTAESADLRLQDRVAEQIDAGGIILLQRIRTTALTTATGAAAWSYLGSDADPAPCSDQNDSICRRHLDGDGSFALDPASPVAAKVVGQIVGGRYTGGPGTLGIPLPAGAEQFTLALYGAHGRAGQRTTMGSPSTPGKVGGAIPDGRQRTPTCCRGRCGDRRAVAAGHRYGAAVQLHRRVRRWCRPGSGSEATRSPSAP